MTENRFLYVLQAAELDDDSTDWAGGIDALKKVIKRDSQKVTNLIESKMRKLQFQQLNLQSKLNSMREEQI